MDRQSLCAAVIVGLSATVPAAASENLAWGDRPLACNDICRAWMSWTPDRGPAGTGLPAIVSEPVVSEPVMAIVPVAPRKARQTREAAAASRGDDRLDQAAPAQPPRKALPWLAAATRTAVPTWRHGAGHGIVTAARRGDHAPSSAELRLPEIPKVVPDSLDAEILARPLYQAPTTVAEAEERPRTGPEPAPGRDEVRVELPSGGVPGSPAPSPPPSPAPVVAERPVAAAAPLQPAQDGQASATGAAAVPITLPKPGPAEKPAPAVMRASDLERLDERPTPSERRPSALPRSRPWTSTIVLGSLSLLSLAGPRRRRRRAQDDHDAVDDRPLPLVSGREFPASPVRLPAPWPPARAWVGPPARTAICDRDVARPEQVCG